METHKYITKFKRIEAKNALKKQNRKDITILTVISVIRYLQSKKIKKNFI